MSDLILIPNACYEAQTDILLEIPDAMVTFKHRYEHIVFWVEVPAGIVITIDDIKDVKQAVADNFPGARVSESIESYLQHLMLTIVVQD